MGSTKISTVQSGEENDDGEGGDENEPDPVPIVPAEDQDVAEPDAVASRKCVVYYLDNGTYSKRGVGMAHVKRLDGVTDSVQLLIRASTSLGMILLNTRINKGMKPVRESKETSGKKQESIQFMSQATPTFKGADPKKMYSWTLKFKDSKEADDVHSAIMSNI